MIEKSIFELELGYFKESEESPTLRSNAKSSRKGCFFALKTKGGQKADKKRFMAVFQLNYRNPIIRRYSDQWFVEYYYRCPADLLQYGYKEWQRFKVYEDINRKKGQDKEDYAKLLCDATLIALKDEGYNPFDAIREQLKKENQVQLKLINSTSLKAAFKQFLDNKRENGLSDDTIGTYESYISKFENYLNIIDSHINVEDLDSAFIKEMLSHLHKLHEWNGTTYNNHLNFWVTLLNWFEAKPRQWVKRSDFVIGVNQELEHKSSNPMKHQYFGNNVAEKVKEHLKEFPSVEIYSRFIYYSCMRPNEIRNLKVENIDLLGRYIKIVGKTKSRTVPICDELAELLSSLNLDKYQLDYYVFGSNGVVSDKKHSENFYLRIFREKIRKPLKLSENFTLYGWKHTRVVDLINAGYKDAEIMQITGHSETSSYDKYKRDLMGNINSKLTGKTIGF